jgi:hypothetical protein
LHCSNSSSTKACKAEKGRRPGGKLAIVRRAPSVLGLRGPQLAVSFSNGRVSMRIRTLQLSASSVKRPPTGSPVVGPPSPAGIPSVGDDDRAGHEARCVGGEEQNDGGDLVDFAHARYRRVVHPSIEQRLRIGGEPGLTRQAEEDYSAHPSLRQVQPNRRHVLPRRLCLRRRTRPLHLPRGQRAGPIPTHLRHSQKRRHSRGHTTLSRQQIGLRRLQTQSAVLS